MTDPAVTTGELWSRFARDLTAYFRRRLPDEQDVEDLLQETFVRIHGGLGNLRSRDRLSVWLYPLREAFWKITGDGHRGLSHSWTMNRSRMVARRTTPT